MINIQKAAVIGCGFVGASTAFNLVQKGLFSELVLIDANREKAEGEAMDLSHGRPFVHSMKIYAGDYDDISDCALIIITAGANQKPGETRLDLVHKNVAIFKSIIPADRGESCGYFDLCGAEDFRVSKRARVWKRNGIGFCQIPISSE